MSTYILIEQPDNGYMIIVDEKRTSAWFSTIEKVFFQNNFEEFKYRNELEKVSTVIINTFYEKPALSYIKTHYLELLI